MTTFKWRKEQSFDQATFLCRVSQLTSELSNEYKSVFFKKEFLVLLNVRQHAIKSKTKNFNSRQTKHLWITALSFSSRNHHSSIKISFRKTISKSSLNSRVYWDTIYTILNIVNCLIYSFHISYFYSTTKHEILQLLILIKGWTCRNDQIIKMPWNQNNYFFF